MYVFFINSLSLRRKKLAFGSRGKIARWMAVSSDKGTIHVFKLSDGPPTSPAIEQATADGSRIAITTAEI